MAAARRNTKVHDAVLLALKRVDYFLADGELSSSDLLEPGLRQAIDDLLVRSASVRTCGLFLAFYKGVDSVNESTLIESAYDFTHPPTGLRGEYGDKLLCEELTKRNITLHGNIVAFAENLGIKGAASNFNFTTDPRFKKFAKALSRASLDEAQKVGSYLASRFAQSQKIMPALPPWEMMSLPSYRRRTYYGSSLNFKQKGMYSSS